MEIFNASYADSLFSAMLTQSNRLESLASEALQRGIDAYTKQDYEGAVKEFKRSVGIGRGSSFAADAAQYLAMAYQQLGDTENAIKAYKSAFQIDPYRGDIHIKLGNLYFSQGKYEILVIVGYRSHDDDARRATAAQRGKNASRPR